jgi:hypothetical protein
MMPNGRAKMAFGNLSHQEFFHLWLDSEASNHSSKLGFAWQIYWFRRCLDGQQTSTPRSENALVL